MWNSKYVDIIRFMCQISSIVTKRGKNINIYIPIEVRAEEVKVINHLLLILEARNWDYDR